MHKTVTYGNFLADPGKVELLGHFPMFCGEAIHRLTRVGNFNPVLRAQMSTVVNSLTSRESLNFKQSLHVPLVDCWLFVEETVTRDFQLQVFS
jgi:hypothetical protein